ncbi:hypothetical protein M3629_05795 [Paenibacillus polysaccharolyticus]|uniref:hypothetical protein n=1 Tax=Paenibacillus polysaccharolyticus TaxID=582692 RepID=UPI002041D176|nr:hypothetical protein [Paenibacillus polysaccharolyticus]MCM3132288.1 hypothetical protein [Paenibacillus polysaccharolyticus]
MKKQSLWMTIPVTTVVLLALAGCGGPDSNQPATSGQPSTTAGSEQTQAGSGDSASSNTGEQGTKTNTASNDSSASTGKDSTANPSTNESTTHSKLSDVDEVVKAVRSELKNQNVSLPTSFPLLNGQYLGAAITTNTAEASHVNFYIGDKPLALNDSSFAKSNSKIPWLASYEVNTYDNPNQTDLFPETDLQNIPKDMSVDLGHGIKGMVEGAAGSQYLTWQEGRWTLQIRSVSEDQMNNPGIAKKMVEYLESHTLPAPKDKGFVDVQYASGGKSVRVTISWQDGNRIHQLKTDQVPLDALGMVVSVK